MISIARLLWSRQWFVSHIPDFDLICQAKWHCSQLAGAFTHWEALEAGHQLVHIIFSGAQIGICGIREVRSHCSERVKSRTKTLVNTCQKNSKWHLQCWFPPPLPEQRHPGLVWRGEEIHGMRPDIALAGIYLILCGWGISFWTNVAVNTCE